jgi:hypothetical protein
MITLQFAMAQFVTVQGVIRDNDKNTIPDGEYTITFKLYSTESDGSSSWTEEQTLTVINGVYGAELGTVESLTSLDWDTQYWLEIASISGADFSTPVGEALSPRTRMTMTPYAIMAGMSGTTNVMPQDGNVGIGTTSPSFKLHVVGNAQIGSGGEELKVGNVGHGNWAGIAHKDNAGGSRYALIQNSSGKTLLNSASGQDLGFRINNSDKMTVKSNGDIGIGITSPAARLHVSGGELRLSRYDNTTHFNHSTNGDAYIRSGNSAGKVILQDTGGKVGIGTSSPEYTLHVNSRMKLGGVSAGVWVEAGANDWLFGRDGTDLRIWNSENLVVFKTNQNYFEKKVKIGDSSFSAGDSRIVLNAGSGNSYHNMIHFNGSNTDGYIEYQDESGDPDIGFSYNGSNWCAWINHHGGYSQSSDRRLKEAIEPLDSVLGKVMQLSPKTYKFKDSGLGLERPTEMGFIAQEVQDHFPSIVDNDKEFLGLTYSKFGILSIKAIQELKAEKDEEISELTGTVNELTETIEALAQRIEELENK